MNEFAVKFQKVEGLAGDWADRSVHQNIKGHVDHSSIYCQFPFLDLVEQFFRAFLILLHTIFFYHVEIERICFFFRRRIGRGKTNRIIERESLFTEQEIKKLDQPGKNFLFWLCGL